MLIGALSPHVPMLIPGIEYSLGEKNSSSNMKIDTLAFLNTLLTHTCPSSVFHPHVATLVPPVEAAVDDPFYKITSEALLVTQQLVKVIHKQMTRGHNIVRCGRVGRGVQPPFTPSPTPHTQSHTQCQREPQKCAFSEFSSRSP